MGDQGAINSSVVNRTPLLVTERAVKERNGENRVDGGGGGRRRNHRPVGEFAGGTAAECAMVCCCCPCAVLDFLVLTLYRVPTGLCRKAWRRRKQKRLLMKKKKMEALEDGKSTSPATATAASANGENEGSRRGSNSVEFEREMWGRFYRGGFWRSTSERED